MIRDKHIEACIDWAYRQGYVNAIQAATNYATAFGCEWYLFDLGQYGDMIKFKDRS